MKGIQLGVFLMFFVSCIMAQSVGGVTTGAATYCTTTNSGFLGLSGQVGTVQTWQISINGGASWTNIPNTTTNQSYFNLTNTACFRAIVKNGGFPADTSTVACITIYQPTQGGNISGGGNVCGNSASGVLTLNSNVGNILNWQSSTDNGATWTNIANTTTTLTYSGITQNTLFAAVVQNSAFCAIDTSLQSGIVLLPPSNAGVLSLAGNDTLCYQSNSGTVTAIGFSGNISGWVSTINNGATYTSIANTSNTLPFGGLTVPTQFAVVVANGICPADSSNLLAVSLFPQPDSVFAGNDTVISGGNSLQLNGSGTGIPNWLPAATLVNANSYTPTATPTANTAYVLFVTDANGCINSDTIQVAVIRNQFDGIISNYFSPNGDGSNEVWYVENILYYPNNEVHIYNIYGQEVFNAKAYQNNWDAKYNGNDLPDGTYYYILKFTDTNKVYKGHIDILRKR